MLGPFRNPTSQFMLEMDSIGLKHSEVFGGVILRVAVPVMHDLPWMQIATDHLFGDKPVLCDVVLFCGVGMIRAPHIPVAPHKPAAAFPLRMPRA